MSIKITQALEQKYFTWALALILLSLVLWVGYQKGKQGREDLWTVDLSRIKADLVLTGVRYTRSENGRIRWVINAAGARFFDEKQLVKLDCVRMQFFTSQNQKVLVQADSGRYDLATEEMSVSGHVKVVSEKGDTLYTDTLHFSNARNLIWSRDRVRMKGGGMEIRGKGFEYYLGQGKFIIRKQKTVIQEGGKIGL